MNLPLNSLLLEVLSRAYEKAANKALYCYSVRGISVVLDLILLFFWWHYAFSDTIEKYACRRKSHPYFPYSDSFNY